MKIEATFEFRVTATSFFSVDNIAYEDDGSGLNANLTLRTGSLGCESCLFYFKNLASFLKAIKRMSNKLRGSAKLGEDDSSYIELAMTGSGLILVQGRVIDGGGFGDVSPLNKLEFTFEGDQTLLPALIKGVENVVSEIRSRKRGVFPKTV